MRIFAVGTHVITCLRIVLYSPVVFKILEIGNGYESEDMAI